MSALIALVLVADGGAFTGTLDKEVIREVAQSHRGEIAACMAASSGSQGKLVVEFEIAPDGAVAAARAAEAGVRPELAACVASAVKTWRFPAPKGGAVKVTYPFMFTSSYEDGGVTMTGPLSKDEIHGVIDAHRLIVRACSEKTPGALGKVVVHFVIGPDGKVMKSELAASTAAAELGECVRQVVTTWKFPAPRGNGIVDVTYPWVFSSE